MSELKRELRLLDAVGIGLGAIVGAGLFVVSGVAAGIAGPGLLVALIVAGAGAACNALSSAQLAAAFPQSGGTYEYGYRVVHPWAGFAAGWMFLASKLAAGSAVVLGIGAYASRYFPGLPPVIVGLCVLAALLAANLAGIKKAGRLNTLIVSVTVASLLLLCVAAVPRVDAAQFSPLMGNGFVSVLHASAVIFFAYTGYARLATLAEEVKEPERTIPRAIVVSLGASIVLYLAVVACAIGVIGASGMADSSSPIQQAADATDAPWASVAVTVGALTAMIGVLLSQILGISRVMFAMARRRDLPSVLSVVSRQGVPSVAVVLTALVIGLLAWFGSLAAVVSAAAFTILLYYSITNVASLRLPQEQRLYPPWISWVGLALCLAMAAAIDLRTIVVGLALLSIGVAVRLLMHSLRPKAGPN